VREGGGLQGAGRALGRPGGRWGGGGVVGVCFALKIL
jgi:hypothetical protein